MSKSVSFPLVNIALFDVGQLNVLHTDSTHVVWYFDRHVLSVGNAESVANLKVQVGEAMQSPTAVETGNDPGGVYCTYEGPIAAASEFCLDGPVPGVAFVDGGVLAYPDEGTMIDD